MRSNSGVPGKQGGGPRNRDPLAPTLPKDLSNLVRRQRILDALASAAARKSLAATTIGDIVAGAGISRATFYKHFPDKRSCFVAVIDSFVAELVGTAEEAQSERVAPADSVREAVSAVLHRLTAKPDYTAVVLAEAAAVEPHLAVAYRDALMDALMWRWVPEGVTPHSDPAARSAFGRAQVLVWDRVAAGSGDRLPELLPDIVYAALLQADLGGEGANGPAPSDSADAAPPAHAEAAWSGPNLRDWKLPRGRHGLPRELVERSQRERLLAAMVRVVAIKGYEETSVADVLKKAGVGRETFYELFEDKQDCFFAAHRMLVDDLVAKVTLSYRRPGPWPEQVRHGLRTLLEWFAADPDVARVAMVELAAVGPTSGGRFRTNFHRFIRLLDEGRPKTAGSQESPNISAIAAGAAFARIFEETVVGRAAQLPRLLPQLTFEVLLPFLGGKAARDEERRAIEETEGREGGRREHDLRTELPATPSQP